MLNSKSLVIYDAPPPHVYFSTQSQLVMVRLNVKSRSTLRQEMLCRKKNVKSLPNDVLKMQIIGYF